MNIKIVGIDKIIIISDIDFHKNSKYFIKMLKYIIL